ncbi:MULTISPECIES: hypothetical protein [unclassified Roseobacter]|uniref:hypothetical protein n=1 Tax=unclassified Roseobacter TaxID=196798 RepID=UPI0030EC178A
MGEDLFYLASKLMRFALYVELWPHILGGLGVMALLVRWRRAALVLALIAWFCGVCDGRACGSLDCRAA